MPRPLPDPVFFLDECLGRGDVAEALRAAGARVEILSDHFEPGTEDATWLADVGRRGWVVLTKDKQIRKRRLERRALEESGVAAFALTGGDMTGPAMAAAFVTAVGRMRKLIRDREAPFLAAISASGSVTLLTDPRRRAGKKKDRR